MYLGEQSYALISIEKYPTLFYTFFMKPLFKLFLLFLLFALFFVVTYAFTGSSFEILFSQEKCITVFSNISQPPGPWESACFWPISFCPYRPRVSMAALGAVYGLWPGTVFSAAGSVGAGLLAMGLPGDLEKKWRGWIASEEEIQKFKTFFDHWGAYAIIIGRAAPVLPEVTTILAGISRMKFFLFLGALVAGAVPVAFVFSAMGAYSGWSRGLVLAWPCCAGPDLAPGFKTACNLNNKSK